MQNSASSKTYSVNFGKLTVLEKILYVICFFVCTMFRIASLTQCMQSNKIVKQAKISLETKTPKISFAHLSPWVRKRTNQVLNQVEQQMQPGTTASTGNQPAPPPLRHTPLGMRIRRPNEDEEK